MPLWCQDILSILSDEESLSHLWPPIPSSLIPQNTQWHCVSPTVSDICIWHRLVAPLWLLLAFKTVFPKRLSAPTLDISCLCKHDSLILLVDCMSHRLLDWKQGCYQSIASCLGAASWSCRIQETNDCYGLLPWRSLKIVVLTLASLWGK